VAFRACTIIKQSAGFFDQGYLASVVENPHRALLNHKVKEE